MVIENPIFVVGVGRSGSTVFHRALSYHPTVAWFCSLMYLRPRSTFTNRWAMRMLNVPFAGHAIRSWFKPVECFLFWEHYCKGFRHPCRDLTRADVTNANKASLHRALGAVPTKRRHRLLMKLTGWPRIGFLREVFPDAKFVHVVRDGRGVVNSMLNVDWWWGWRGPQNWRWGELPPEMMAEWEKHDRSFVALAALEWKLLMTAYDKVVPTLDPGQYTEVKYEDFCAAPMDVFREVSAFVGLQWTPAFERKLSGMQFHNANSKWQTELTTAQQTILNDVLAEPLAARGYV